jgi:hypothetical protein
MYDMYPIFTRYLYNMCPILYWPISIWYLYDMYKICARYYTTRYMCNMCTISIIYITELLHKHYRYQVPDMCVIVAYRIHIIYISYIYLVPDMQLIASILTCRFRSAHFSPLILRPKIFQEEKLSSY